MVERGLPTKFGLGPEFMDERRTPDDGRLHNGSGSADKVKLKTQLSKCKYVAKHVFRAYYCFHKTTSMAIVGSSIGYFLGMPLIIYMYIHI